MIGRPRRHAFVALTLLSGRGREVRPLMFGAAFAFLAYFALA